LILRLIRRVAMARDVGEIRAELREEAERISERYGGAPVAIIVAGSRAAGVPACVTEFANLGEGREGRMRDQLGILQAAIQIESKRHLVDKQLNTLAQRVAAIEGKGET